ncbi:MAG: GNAT family N-acetyltransferase [Terricaulis sp.]
MLRIETIHPKELGCAEIALWRAQAARDAALRSPYFAPEWAMIVGAERDDARVCVIDGGAGFFAAQRLSRFAAMGLGAPIADYQGVVGQVAPAAELCRSLGVGRIDLTHVPAGQSILAGGDAREDASWIAETFGGREAYEAALRERRSEFLRQTDKKLRKFAREQGPPRFCAQSSDSADFEQLLTWKCRQLRASGQPEIWATPWVRAVLDVCFATREQRFGGMLFTLKTGGDQLAAAAFCLRSVSVLHFWVIAHDDAYNAYSPGVQLARWVVGWAGEHGFAEVDFGPGEYQYKRQLATTQRKVESGVAAGASWSGVVRRAQWALRRSVERMPQAQVAALPGKAMRRIDLRRALG